MPTVSLTTVLAPILADPHRVPLTLGRAAASELGLAVLEHLEGGAPAQDVDRLVAYAARHEESAPARDALLAVLLNASATLPAALVEHARAAVQAADWGEGRETAGLVDDPDIAAVPRRQALAERLMAERARRLRPKMHAYVAAILAGDPNAVRVPSGFLERNWLDLRDTLAQRVRHEPMHRAVIARWVAVQPAAIRSWMQPVEEALVEVATQAILQTPLRAPLAPYCDEERVAEGVRTAVTFRGAPARERLAGYLARLTPGTPWYETIREMVEPPSAG